jgi:ABC-type uncharacterized transport system auxiliary subunit
MRFSLFKSRASQALLALCSAALLSGCASTLNGQRSANWELFDSAKPAAAVTDQSRIVVYRLAGANDTGEAELKPVNVFVNEAYLTSLLPNASANTLICPGTHRVSALPNRQRTVLAHNSATASQYVSSQYASVQAAASEVQYFKVEVVQGGTIRLEQQRAEQALSDIELLPRQAHTLARTALLECGNT